MATQEEWRKIDYQRSLGEQGVGTGSLENKRGLDEYLRKKREAEAGWDTPDVSGAGPRLGSPARFGGNGKTISSAMLLSLVAAGGVYLAGYSLSVTAITFGISLILLKLVSLFFTTELGSLIIFFVSAAVSISLVLLLIYALWYLASPQIALWVAGGTIIYVGFPFAASMFWGWYYHFKQTPRGAKFDRRMTWLVRAVVLGSIAFAGFWIVMNF